MELYDKAINGITFQTSRQLEELGVKHGFTARAGGVSEGIFSSLNLGWKTNEDDPDNVLENYRRVCSALDIDITKLVLSKQVHSDGIRTVTLDDAGKWLNQPLDYEADGLVTNIPGLTLAVFGADCLTMIMYDPVCLAVAAVHAGWRGTVAGIAKKAAETMKTNFGCDASNIRAALGPCISRCCFETGSEVVNAMTDAFGEAARPFYDEKENGKFMVDLKGLNAMQLESTGILKSHIDISEDCTKCLSDKYWSHRATNGKRGIQAALISL